MLPKVTIRKAFQIAFFFLFFARETIQAIFGAKCSKNSDCHLMYNDHYICSNLKCRREDLFPTSTKSNIGILLLTFISAVANAGGLGGGAVIVPVYIFLFDYVTAESIPMSKATIFAGAIMNVFLIACKKHPKDENKLLVDYGLAGTVIPLLLGGTMIGVLLTNILPPIITIVFLSLYLFYSTTGMYKKALKLHKQEEMEKLEKTAKAYKDHGLGEIDNLGTNDENNKLLEEDDVEGSARNKEERENNLRNRRQNEIDESESNTDIFEMDTPNIKEGIPYKSIFLDCFFMVIAFLGILVVTFLRGGHGMNSIIGIKMCSIHSWSLLILAQLLCFGCCMINKNRHLDELVGKEDSEDYKVRKGKLRTLLIASYGSGVGAGLLGIGGGMIMNPVLLGLGFIPEVAAAVAGFSVLFTSSSTTSQFIVAGAVIFKQAIWYLFFSSIGSLIGNIIIFRLVRKYNKPSILVWILFGLLASSVVVLPTMGIYNIYRKGRIFEFNSPC